MPRDADGFLWDVLGLGCVAVDDLLYIPAYPPPDSKVRVRRRERQGGGLTGTALVAAARLGARCAFAGVLGDDEDSRFVEDCFRRDGVDTSPVVRRRGARPIRSTILVDESRHTRTIFFDLAGSTGADPEAPPAEVIRAARVLFVDHYGVEGMTRAARIAAPPASPWSPTWSATSIRASRRCWGWSIISSCRGPSRRGAPGRTTRPRPLAFSGRRAAAPSSSPAVRTDAAIWTRTGLGRRTSRRSACRSSIRPAAATCSTAPTPRRSRAASTWRSAALRQCGGGPQGDARRGAGRYPDAAGGRGAPEKLILVEALTWKASPAASGL